MRENFRGHVASTHLEGPPLVRIRVQSASEGLLVALETLEGDELRTAVREVAEGLRELNKEMRPPVDLDATGAGA